MRKRTWTVKGSTSTPVEVKGFRTALQALRAYRAEYGTDWFDATGLIWRGNVQNQNRFAPGKWAAIRFEGDRLSGRPEYADPLVIDGKERMR